MINGTARAGGVHVSIPVSTAANIDSFKKGVQTVLDQLGCKACCSGYDITFEIQRNLFLNKDMNIETVSSLKTGTEAITMPAGLSPKASITIPTQVGNNIDNVKRTIDKVAERLGCPACCSGFDLSFRNELNFVMDMNGNLH